MTKDRINLTPRERVVYDMMLRKERGSRFYLEDVRDCVYEGDVPVSWRKATAALMRSLTLKTAHKDFPVVLAAGGPGRGRKAEYKLDA